MRSQNHSGGSLEVGEVTEEHEAACEPGPGRGEGDSGHGIGEVLELGRSNI